MSSVDQLTDLLVRLGQTPSAEAPGFTELDHGLQCAFELASRFPDDIELQIAGLVHDVGHQFGPDDHHGRLGGEAILPVLGKRIASLVSGHVQAKRYLVTVEPGYRSGLSAVSTTTLAAQGGTLSPGELRSFRRAPHWRDTIELRRADDAAKQPGRAVPGLDHWLPTIRRVAGRRVAGRRVAGRRSEGVGRPPAPIDRFGSWARP